MRNKFEKRVDAQLQRSKIKYKYESERIPYVLAKHYIPDFILETKLGKVYVECKGYFRTTDKEKLRAVKRQHPELDIRILFYTKRTQYVKWCIRYGFRYAIEKIPKEWLDGL